MAEHQGKDSAFFVTFVFFLQNLITMNKGTHFIGQQ